MNTIGVLLLAAATAGDGFGYTKPGVGLKKLLRPHVVAHGAPPAGGMISDMGPGGPGGPAGALGGICQCTFGFEAFLAFREAGFIVFGRGLSTRL